MNALSADQRVQAVRLLCEGTSMRAVARMVGIARNTIASLLVDVGEACATYLDEHLRELTCRRLQGTEIRTFVDGSRSSVPFDLQNEIRRGEVWTFAAIDADTRLVPSWLIGPPNLVTAAEFTRDVASRLASSVHLGADWTKRYEEAFGEKFAQTVNVGGPSESAGRLRITSCDDRAILKNYGAAIALYFLHYNFASVHSLGVTPAVAAGVADHVWSLGEIVGLAE